jgi:hypothetical protein
MKAELKELVCLDFDLNSYWPDDEDNFGFILRAMIGPDNGESAEAFDIQVCTFEWLKENYKLEKVFFAYQMVIVTEYDIEDIKTKIEDFCKSCVGDDWQAIAYKLNLIGGWEFENYQPFKG